MALIDVYTDRNEPAGYTVEKKEAHAKGLWHRVFTCLVINTDNKTAYLQKKTPGRYSFDRPDHMDVTVGGHYEAGEAIEAGVREMEEEIGLKVSFEQLVSLGQRQTSVVLAKDYDNNEFQHIFLLPTKTGLTGFKYADNEVSGLVEIPVFDGIRLMRGEISDLKVNGCFSAPENSAGKEIVDMTITKDDFVPAYLKTDEFMIRLFVAAHRYLSGEDAKLLYW
jgi:isopentenyldiphosphate isomerase